MPIVRPAHYSIRTRDLDASQRFYTEVLQLRAGFRPPFNFPGAWLYADRGESEFGIVHLVGATLGYEEDVPGYHGARTPEDVRGSGSLDHIAFLATDWPEMRQRCDALGIGYQTQYVPS